MAESNTVESKYKNVVDGLLKAIDDVWKSTLERSTIGEAFEIKLPIKKIDELNVFVYFKIQRITDGCYIKIRIVSSYIISKKSYYSKNFKHDNASEKELYNFFNDLENLKLDYYGCLSTRGDGIFINVLNCFNGLIIEGIEFDDINDKKCCVCSNFTLTYTNCNHRYCNRCRSKNIEITKKDLCPMCRTDLKYRDYDYCDDDDDDDDDDDEDYEDEDEEENDDDDDICSGCGCVHCNEEEYPDDDDEDSDDESSNDDEDDKDSS
jgi:hypothetical protein